MLKSDIAKCTKKSANAKNEHKLNNAGHNQTGDNNKPHAQHSDRADHPDVTTEAKAKKKKKRSKKGKKVNA
jgi:hypothetical protein